MLFFLALAGFGALLGLDIAGKIHEPWWVISAPLWGLAVLVLFFLIVFGVASASISRWSGRWPR